MMFLPVTTTAGVRRALSASWRLYYEARHAELSGDPALWNNLPRLYYRAPIPAAAGPFDWHPSGRYVWQSTRDPHVGLLLDGGSGGCLVMLPPRQSLISRIEAWANAETQARLPSNAILSDLYTNATSRGYSSRGQAPACHRGRLTLGHRVGNDQVNARAQVHVFNAREIVAAGALPARWATALAASGGGVGPLPQGAVVNRRDLSPR